MRYFLITNHFGRPIKYTGTLANDRIDVKNGVIQIETTNKLLIRQIEVMKAIGNPRIIEIDEDNALKHIGGNVANKHKYDAEERSRTLADDNQKPRKTGKSGGSAVGNGGRPKKSRRNKRNSASKS
jgi:hypothetical protein